MSQIKDGERSDRKVVQVAFNKTSKKDGRISGHLKKANIKENLNKFAEFKAGNDLTTYKLGDIIDVSVFEKGDKVTVSGISKGRGFAGVIKRHGFHGSPRSHGHKHDWRSGGSIGAAFPQHVFKGQKMPGRMGADKVTLKNLEVVGADDQDKVLIVKGSVPGANGSWLRIRCLN